MQNCHIFLARPILSLCLCYAVFDAISAKCYTYRILTLSTISLQQITLSVKYYVPAKIETKTKINK